uniref:Uncharacterized protein n=1 Tax=Eutreptiella gymnastica TaxID=73025 RepID=A0A7S4LQE5_9EUGL|mmetsp:Transcript_94620/g.158852  ORF Transcript_94620/g.158852 Transcript_94620/m.158852 type:complete len:122 (+) Transcript_94620:243-608(+)
MSAIHLILQRGNCVQQAHITAKTTLQRLATTLDLTITHMNHTSVAVSRAAKDPPAQYTVQSMTIIGVKTSPPLHRTGPQSTSWLQPQSWHPSIPSLFCTVWVGAPEFQAFGQIVAVLTLQL